MEEILHVQLPAKPPRGALNSVITISDHDQDVIIKEKQLLLLEVLLFAKLNHHQFGRRSIGVQ